MGLGRKLMDALISHLKKKDIKGVVLGVSAQNEKGINFYKKYGGKVIETIDFPIKDFKVKADIVEFIDINKII